MNCLTLSLISSRTRRKASVLCSGNPPAVLGSTILQRRRWSVKGNIGLLSLAVSRMATTQLKCCFTDWATRCGSWPDMSTPASCITSLARGFKALGSTPALATSNRSPVTVRKNPSASMPRAHARNLHCRILGRRAFRQYSGVAKEAVLPYLRDQFRCNLTTNGARNSIH